MKTFIVVAGENIRIHPFDSRRVIIFLMIIRPISTLVNFMVVGSIQYEEETIDFMSSLSKIVRWSATLSRSRFPFHMLAKYLSISGKADL